MKISALLHSARASRASKVHPLSAGSKGLVRRHLSSWVGLSALLLAPALIISTPDLAVAGRSSCGGSSRSRPVSCSKSHISQPSCGSARSCSHVRSRSYCAGLGLGSAGPEVAILQQRLSYLGFPVAVDGVFGPETSHAVRAFQAANGLTPDGCVGSATASALRQDTRIAHRPSPCGKAPCITQPIRPLPHPIEPIVREGLRYVVAIPSDDPETLGFVRRIAPGAFFADSRLGTFINAGSFTDRDPAQTQAEVLRAFGLDAQVRHRDF
jgi:hypothetical protein